MNVYEYHGQVYVTRHVGGDQYRYATVGHGVVDWKACAPEPKFDEIEPFCPADEWRELYSLRVVSRVPEIKDAA